MSNLEKQYKNICEKYIKKFCKKQDMEFEFWVGDIVGDVAYIGDFYFNFRDIVHDVNSNQPKGNIVMWYYQCLDAAYSHLNYYTFTKKD